MKAFNQFFTIMLLCSVLVSCNQNEPDPEEMKQKAVELATFLSDNYSKGDSVFFVTETGKTEGFVVKASELFTKQISDEELKFILEGYAIYTILESSNKTYFDIEMHLNSYTPPVYPEVYGNISISYNWGSSSNGEPITTVKEDSIFINRGDESCVLVKNVGIVSISSRDHTWTLKR